MGSKLHVGACILSLLSAAALAQPVAYLPSDGDAVAMEVNGVKVTFAELERNHAAAMFQARSNYYEAARKTMDEYADELLLEQQARKENLTVAQLLEKHVTSTIAKDPSEETLRVYYETADTTEPYASVRVKLIEAIRDHRIAKAKAAYLKSLREQSTVAILLRPPRAPITSEEVVPRGPANPRVVLTEYADYECPYCQQSQPMIDKLEAEFKGTMAFRYKDYPLPMHPNAEKAAEASRCAEAQGKYWEYHDLLVTTKQLDLPSLKAHARLLKLDGAAFDRCLDTGEKAAQVKAEAAEAQALGLQGTPTFFINGRYISGALTYERLRAVILEELGAQGQPAAALRSASAQR
jgi:protein-disulfide isomerase